MAARKHPRYNETQQPGYVEASGSDLSENKGRVWPFVLLGVLIAGAAAAALFFFTDIFDKPADPEPPVDPGYQTPYTWANLATDARERLYYSDAAGAKACLIGIDCSEWDTDTNWTAVAADGIEFAIIRMGYRGATEGGLYVDEGFEVNYAGATENGIPVGLYFYSQAKTPMEAREEADFIIKTLAGRPVDLPIFFDHEGYNDPEGRAFGLDNATYSLCAKVFCNRIRHAGYSAGIYGNRGALGKVSPEIRDANNIWFAEWDTDIPHAQFDFCMWQYTSEGSVEGMWRQIDTTIWFLNEVPLKTPAGDAAPVAAIVTDAGVDAGAHAAAGPAN